MYKPVMFFVCASLPMWAFNAAEVSSETASLECIKVVLTYPGWCEIVPLKEYCARQETVFVHCAKCTVGFPNGMTVQTKTCQLNKVDLDACGHAYCTHCFFNTLKKAPSNDWDKKRYSLDCVTCGQVYSDEQVRVMVAKGLKLNHGGADWLVTAELCKRESSC